ncbi:MAG TPA: hypothetical protein VMK12_12375, partial [Anaeromyxobacteraceae bacterium]|nr:hypothetical protein [Anaeromyxobacteraceae bacterium]
MTSIRTEVDQLLTTEASLLWEAWTHGTTANLEASLASHEELFSRESLAIVRGARERALGDEKRALGLLSTFLAGEHLARETSASPEHLPQASFWWGGRVVTARRVPSILAAEPDPGKRAMVEHAFAEAEHHSAQAQQARWRAIALAAERVGYDSLIALTPELRGESVDALAALAEDVLDRTDATYRALAEPLARNEMGKGFTEARGRDLPRLFRASDDARAHPASRAVEDVEQTLASMGLDLSSRGVLFDLEARP